MARGVFFQNYLAGAIKRVISTRMSDATKKKDATRKDATRKDATRKDAVLGITFPGDLAGSHALIEQLVCTVNSQAAANEQLRREKQEVELAFAEYVRAPVPQAP